MFRAVSLNYFLKNTEHDNESFMKNLVFKKKKKSADMYISIHVYSIIATIPVTQPSQYMMIIAYRQENELKSIKKNYKKTLWPNSSFP